MKTLKPFTKFLLIIFIAGFTITSCSKGDKGETGPQGEKGAQGVAGPDGSTILNGNYRTIFICGQNRRLLY